MCITLLSKTLQHVDLVEQIWLRISPAGQLQVEEVYDIFFHNPAETTESPVETTLLALHPHRLLNGEEQLAVEVDPTPGSKAKNYDHVYALGCEFTPEENTFTVYLPATSQQFEPQSSPYAGQVLRPSARVPAKVASHGGAVDLMTRENGLGTVFELPLGSLQPGRDYALRVIIRPVALNRMLPGTNIRLPNGSESTTWEQACEIIAPQMLYGNMFDWLDRIPHSPADRGSAVLLKNMLAGKDEHDRHFRPVHVFRHRLFLLYSHGCTCIEHNEPGYISFMGPRQFHFPGEGVHFRGMEWQGGTEEFPQDDPVAVAYHVIKALRKDSGQRSQGKEELARSLDILPWKLEPVIEALRKLHFLAGKEGERLAVGPKATGNETELTKGIRAAFARDKQLQKRFQYTGFQVQYTVQFQYESEQVRHRRLAEQRKVHWGFWIGVVSFILGLVSLILALASLILTVMHKPPEDSLG